MPPTSPRPWSLFSSVIIGWGIALHCHLSCPLQHGSLDLHNEKVTLGQQLSTTTATGTLAVAELPPRWRSSSNPRSTKAQRCRRRQETFIRRKERHQGLVQEASQRRMGEMGPHRRLARASIILYSLLEGHRAQTTNGCGENVPSQSRRCVFSFALLINCD